MTKEELIEFVERVVNILSNKTRGLERELDKLRNGTSPYLKSENDMMDLYQYATRTATGLDESVKRKKKNILKEWTMQTSLDRGDGEFFIEVEFDISDGYSGDRDSPAEDPEVGINSVIDIETGEEIELDNEEERYVLKYINDNYDWESRPSRSDRGRRREDEGKVIKNGKLIENKTMENKITSAIALLEKVSGQKVVFKEKKAIEHPDKIKARNANERLRKVKLAKEKEEAKAKVKKESVVTEAKDEKEKKGEKASSIPKADKSGESSLVAATQNADEPILGNIIPSSVIKQIDTYVSNTLAEIDKATTQLRAIKRQIAGGATATNEDFSTLTERIAFLVKQLSRISLYASNTIKSGKFDKGLLDKIFDQKVLKTSVTSAMPGSSII